MRFEGKPPMRGIGEGDLNNVESTLQTRSMVWAVNRRRCDPVEFNGVVYPVVYDGGTGELFIFDYDGHERTAVLDEDPANSTSRTTISVAAKMRRVTYE